MIKAMAKTEGILLIKVLAEEETTIKVCFQLHKDTPENNIRNQINRGTCIHLDWGVVLGEAN